MANDEQNDPSAETNATPRNMSREASNEPSTVLTDTEVEGGGGRRPKRNASQDVTRVVEALGTRSVVLIGLMGAGKSSVGRRLSARLGLPFVDADTEIEKAADQSISEIFADHGEAYFRDGERRVIARLLGEGPQVLATGGGAYMDPSTRAEIRGNGVSVWLRADIDLLLKRVKKRDNRPLLKVGDVEATMRRLVEERHPFYGEADITVQSRDVPHERMVAQIIDALEMHTGLAT